MRLRFPTRGEVTEIATAATLLAIVALVVWLIFSYNQLPVPRTLVPAAPALVPAHAAGLSLTTRDESRPGNHECPRYVASETKLSD